MATGARYAHVLLVERSRCRLTNYLVARLISSAAAVLLLGGFALTAFVWPGFLRSKDKGGPGGGGNAERITVKLPENVKIVSNVAGLLGGLALWRD